jgi:DNA-binding SARP family transcriptional activator/streptogramin lyase
VKIILLGPFAVVNGDGEAAVGRGNERALLALLALHANAALPTDRIVDAMWGERPPASARDMVRLYVSRARGRIGERLVTEASGYSLRATEDEVDLAEFERLRRAGSEALSTGAAAVAATHLRGALDLWRGDPLVEFADFPFAREEIPRLAELRLGTIEDYNDARLATGEAAQLIPSLERLVDENPYRERLRGQLMLSLYRSGRQTDALARYREGRRLLVDEVGVEPGPRLRELERAILQHDADLTPLQRPRSDGAPPERRRPGRRRPIIVATVAVAALGAGVTTYLVETTGAATSLRSLPENSVGLVDVSSGRLQAAIGLPGVPVDMTASSGRLWVALGEPHAVAEIEPARKTLDTTIRLVSVPRRVAPGTRGVWVANSYDGTISRIDATTHAVGKPERLFPPTRISFAGGDRTLWATGSPGNGVVRLNPRTGRVDGRIRGLDNPISIALGFGELWLASSRRAEVQLVTGRTVRTIPIGSLPTAVTTGTGAVWAVSPADGKLWRIDPRGRDVVAAIGAGSDPTFLAAGGGSIWVGSARDGVLIRVNPNTNKVDEAIHLGRPIGGLTFDGDQLWVAVQ